MNQQRHILFINRSYWPDAEATGQLLTELCEQVALDDQVEVSVICGQPNFNLEEIEFKAKGKVVHNGVNVIRVRHTQFDKSTFSGRVINFITYMIAATWRALFCRRPDVIVVETDPPILCLSAWLVSAIRGTKLVCYLQDIYPDIAIELGRLSYNLFTRLLRWSFLFVYRRANRVVVVGHDMRKWLINHLVDESRIEVIENWVDAEEVTPIKENNTFRHKFDLEDKFVVMYSGNIGFTQRFDLVLDAAEELRDNRDIVFAFVGNGVKRGWLSEESIRRGLPNVRLIDYQPKSELAISLSAADVHFVLLDSNLTQLMMPSKVYAAMASGTPVIGLGQRATSLGSQIVASHLAAMIEDASAGYFVDESEPEQLAERIVELSLNPALAEEMGQNARLAATRKYNREIPVGRFKSLFYELCQLHNSAGQVDPVADAGIRDGSTIADAPVATRR
ncbi:MAG: glycosyltransferase family 4 protein [Planctomycetota bacterium]